jgi:hypothetical protein
MRTDHEANTFVFRRPTEQDIIDHKDKPAYCNYCRMLTDTCDYDCDVCGLSKPHPDVEGDN